MSTSQLHYRSEKELDFYLLSMLYSKTTALSTFWESFFLAVVIVWVGRKCCPVCSLRSWEAELSYDGRHLYLEMKKLIEEQPGISLNAIASVLRIERHTATRIIRCHTGLSFRDYRNERLQAVAIELLAQPNLSIKQVALSLGYEHPRDFSRFFREKTGNSPSQYREATGD